VKLHLFLFLGILFLFGVNVVSAHGDETLDSDVYDDHHGMMSGFYGGFGMGFFGWFFMVLIVVALILFIVWLLEQLLKPKHWRRKK